MTKYRVKRFSGIGSALSSVASSVAKNSTLKNAAIGAAVGGIGSKLAGGSFKKGAAIGAGVGAAGSIAAKKLGGGSSSTPNVSLPETPQASSAPQLPVATAGKSPLNIKAEDVDYEEVK
jgi:hypothetical protein